MVRTEGFKKTSNMNPHGRPTEYTADEAITRVRTGRAQDEMYQERGTNPEKATTYIAGTPAQTPVTPVKTNNGLRPVGPYQSFSSPTTTTTSTSTDAKKDTSEDDASKSKKPGKGIKAGIAGDAALNIISGITGWLAKKGEDTRNALRGLMAGDDALGAKTGERLLNAVKADTDSNQQLMQNVISAQQKKDKMEKDAGIDKLTIKQKKQMNAWNTLEKKMLADLDALPFEERGAYVKKNVTEQMNKFLEENGLDPETMGENHPIAVAMRKFTNHANALGQDEKRRRSADRMTEVVNARKDQYAAEREAKDARGERKRNKTEILERQRAIRDGMAEEGVPKEIQVMAQSLDRNDNGYIYGDVEDANGFFSKEFYTRAISSLEKDIANETDPARKKELTDAYNSARGALEDLTVLDNSLKDQHIMSQLQDPNLSTKDIMIRMYGSGSGKYFDTVDMFGTGLNLNDKGMAIYSRLQQQRYSSVTNELNGLYRMKKKTPAAKKRIAELSAIKSNLDGEISALNIQRLTNTLFKNVDEQLYRTVNEVDEYGNPINGVFAQMNKTGYDVSEGEAFYRDDTQAIQMYEGAGEGAKRQLMVDIGNTSREALYYLNKFNRDKKGTARRTLETLTVGEIKANAKALGIDPNTLNHITNYTDKEGKLTEYNANTSLYEVTLRNMDRLARDFDKSQQTTRTPGGTVPASANQVRSMIGYYVQEIMNRPVPSMPAAPPTTASEAGEAKKKAKRVRIKFGEETSIGDGDNDVEFYNIPGRTEPMTLSNATADDYTVGWNAILDTSRRGSGIIYKGKKVGYFDPSTKTLEFNDGVPEHTKDEIAKRIQGHMNAVSRQKVCKVLYTVANNPTMFGKDKAEKAKMLCKKIMKSNSQYAISSRLRDNTSKFLTGINDVLTKDEDLKSIFEAQLISALWPSKSGDFKESMKGYNDNLFTTKGGTLYFSKDLRKALADEIARSGMGAEEYLRTQCPLVRNVLTTLDNKHV